MKRWRLLGIGLVTYALGAIAIAPATLLDAGLQHASEGRLRLVEAQGTLWSGAGQIEIRDSAGRTGAAKSIVWHLRLASLWRGLIVCDVVLESSTKPLPLTLSFSLFPSRLEVGNAEISLPASVLGLGVPRLAPLGLRGELLLQITGLSVGRERFEGKLSLRWRDAGSQLTPVAPLGDYELNLEGEGAMTQLSLQTLKGPLQLDGKSAWAAGGKPGLLVKARVPVPYQQQLSPLLRLIAVERGTGNFDLELK